MESVPLEEGGEERYARARSDEAQRATAGREARARALAQGEGAGRDGRAGGAQKTGSVLRGKRTRSPDPTGQAAGNSGGHRRCTPGRCSGQRWRESHRPEASDPEDLGFDPLDDGEEVTVDARKRAWARLLAKVYEIDPLGCPNSGSRRRISRPTYASAQGRRTSRDRRSIRRLPHGTIFRVS